MTVVNDSTITVTVPPGTGQVSVIVRSPNGDSTDVADISDFSYA